MEAIFPFIATSCLKIMVKWCTCQSPTAGLVVKLQSDEYMRDIHVIDDFYLNFEKILSES